MRVWIALSFCFSPAIVLAVPTGAELFQANCAACHMPDQKVVGPSLVEIRGLYQGKEDDFVKWCVKPFKKRAEAIEMPSMVHVGDAGLREIYKHVMQVSQGLVEKEMKSGDPFANSPTQAMRPQVMRIFMPNAGPAAIAVALDQVSSLCWDAGECRLRYAWTGGFIDGFPYWKGNGSQLAQVVGTVKYIESESPFGALADNKKYFGYKMENGLPLFKYRIGESEVTESFAASPAAKGFVRNFTVSEPQPEGLELRFPSDQNVKYSSDKGIWKDSVLKLTPAEAAAFTITISYP
jgi:cytochrome c551/c552